MMIPQIWMKKQTLFDIANELKPLICQDTKYKLLIPIEVWVTFVLYKLV